jgi:hypothetical protein
VTVFGKVAEGDGDRDGDEEDREGLAEELGLTLGVGLTEIVTIGVGAKLSIATCGDRPLNQANKLIAITATTTMVIKVFIIIYLKQLQ